eukprot:1159117-Pelagomonas_calceolata.AAC.1
MERAGHSQVRKVIQQCPWPATTGTSPQCAYQLTGTDGGGGAFLREMIQQCPWLAANGTFPQCAYQLTGTDGGGAWHSQVREMIQKCPWLAATGTSPQCAYQLTAAIGTPAKSTHQPADSDGRREERKHLGMATSSALGLLPLANLQHAHALVDVHGRGRPSQEGKLFALQVQGKLKAYLSCVPRPQHQVAPHVGGAF